MEEAKFVTQVQLIAECWLVVIAYNQLLIPSQHVISLA